MHRFIDETNNTYGSLTVLKYSHTGEQGAIWKCKCNDCGSICYVSGTQLRSGNRISCGCSRSKPRKPKSDVCVICGRAVPLIARNMCRKCYTEQWKKKRDEELQRYY